MFCLKAFDQSNGQLYSQNIVGLLTLTMEKLLTYLLLILYLMRHCIERIVYTQNI